MTPIPANTVSMSFWSGMCSVAGAQRKDVPMGDDERPDIKSTRPSPPAATMSGFEFVMGLSQATLPRPPMADVVPFKVTGRKLFTGPGASFDGSRLKFAKGLHDKVDLGAHGCGRVLFLLHTLLNQGRMEERQERCDRSSCGFLGVFDLELACLQTLADKCFEDR